MAPDTVFLGGTGVDGLAVVGGVWDFEDGTMQGWAALDDLDLPGGPASITCPLTNDPANDFVLLAANRSGVGYPHPEHQHERIVSPPAYVGAGSGLAAGASALEPAPGGRGRDASAR